ncbi:Jacalin-like lectin domain [Phytophthora cactorum]|nr:Jacalin-like lectin domain [Phytophthora cactorum]
MTWITETAIHLVTHLLIVNALGVFSDPSVVQLSESFGGPHGKDFSDENDVSAGQIIGSITLHVGKRCHGLELQVAAPVAQTFTHGGDGGTLNTLTLNADEYITSMEAHWGKHKGHTRIFYLSFGTSDGKSVSGGSMTDSKSTVTAPEGFQLGGFFGRQGDELDLLGAIWTRIEAVTAAPVVDSPGTVAPADIQDPVTKPPGSTKIGRRATLLSESFGGPHGDQFSDQSSVKSGQKVKSLTLHIGNRCHGLELQIAEPVAASFAHGGEGGNYKTLTLREDEYITSMEAHWGKKDDRTRIFYLSFGTNFGITVSGGTKTDTKNSVSAPVGYQLGGFFGRDGDEIDLIGVVWSSIEVVEETPVSAVSADEDIQLSEVFGGPHGIAFSDINSIKLSQTVSTIALPPEGFQLSGFHGRSESEIDQLGVIWTRIGAKDIELMDMPGSDNGTNGTSIRNWVGPNVGNPSDTACYRKSVGFGSGDVCPLGYGNDDDDCLAQCPLSYPVRCYAECIPQNDDCALEIMTKIGSVVVVAFNIATLNVFGEIMALYKTTKWAITCAANIISVVRSLIYFLRYQQTTAPQGDTEVLLTVAYQSDVVLIDLPVAVCACLGLPIPKKAQYADAALSIVEGIVKQAITNGDEILSSGKNALNLLTGSSVLNDSSTTVDELQDLINKKSSCGWELKRLTDRVVYAVNDVRNNTPNAAVNDIRVTVYSSAIVLNDIPTVTNNCMGELLATKTMSAAYETRDLLRKTFGVIIDQVIEKASTDMGASVAEDEYLLEVSNMGLVALSTVDPTGIAYMASQFVQPICGPTAYLGEIDDGTLHDALSLTTVDEAFEGSYGSWTKVGDGVVRLIFKSTDTEDVTVVIHSGGDDYANVDVNAGETVTWESTISELHDKNMYLDRWRPGLSGLPASGGGSLLLWIPRASEGGHITMSIFYGTKLLKLNCFFLIDSYKEDSRKVANAEMVNKAKQASGSAQLSATTFEVLQSTTTGANVCKRAIYVAYEDNGISKNDLDVTVAAVMITLRQIRIPPREDKASSVDFKYMYAAKEFRATYVGDADLEFRSCLAASCSAYLAHTSDYTAPCVTIKQSSGFGKSRILQRLAESTAEGKPLVHAGNQFDAVVLYVFAKKLRKSKPDGKAPVLVVAIDEAQDLRSSTGIDALWMLLGALRPFVNNSEMARDANGIVFVVLVDAYSQSTYYEQNRVLATNAEEVWRALVSMGRSLWRSRQRGSTLADRQKAMNLLAASKLLRGQKARLAESYNDNTVNGVASLFCRAWLQPRACDPIAVRLVTDFMSVLHYTSYKNDAHITSYTSYPILAFGAARLWYQLEPPALEAHILPQFQTMLPSGVVDTRKICQIVARIFLLLVMDATSMGAEVRTNVRARSEFGFARQFCDVLSFVTVLLGDNTKVLDESKLDDRWTSGILSRNSGGADLVIPISCSDQASFVLVQVSDNEEEEDASVVLALRNLEPSNFKAEHPLHNAPPHEMIRLYISPRGVVTPNRPAQQRLDPLGRAVRERVDKCLAISESMVVRVLAACNVHGEEAFAVPPAKRGCSPRSEVENYSEFITEIINDRNISPPIRDSANAYYGGLQDLAGEATDKAHCSNIKGEMDTSAQFEEYQIAL